MRQLMTTTAMLLALTGGAWAADSSASTQSKAAKSGGDSIKTVVDLNDWDYDALYQDSWRASTLIGQTAYGRTGEEIGEIHNIVIGPDERIKKVIVEGGGFLDIGDTHFALPWSDVTIANGRVSTPVVEGTLEQYDLFGENDFVSTGPRAWKATELLDDYVRLSDGRGYGVVEDLLFDKQGRVQAVIVEPNLVGDYDGPYAVPYYGFGMGFDPGLGHYDLPYTTADLATIGEFDTAELNEPFGRS